MPVISSGKSSSPSGNGVATTRKRTKSHTTPKPPGISLDQPGRIRVANFQWLLGGISASAFYQRIKTGKVPKPCGEDGRPYWRTEVVKKFLEE